MKNILIFGGAFNPPTLAHEAIIRACLGQAQFDEVWVMPSGSRIDKTIPTSDEDRLRMLEAVRSGTFAGDPRLVVSDFELRLPRPSATAHTITALAAAYPDATFWFAFGGDSYRSMSTWPDADTFMHDLRMLVFTDNPNPPAASDKLLLLHVPATLGSVSSTLVRTALAQDDDASAWLSAGVHGYIAQHGLYR